MTPSFLLFVLSVTCLNLCSILSQGKNKPKKRARTLSF